MGYRTNGHPVLLLVRLLWFLLSQLRLLTLVEQGREVVAAEWGGGLGVGGGAELGGGVGVVVDWAVGVG